MHTHLSRRVSAGLPTQPTIQEGVGKAPSVEDPLTRRMLWTPETWRDSSSCLSVWPPQQLSANTSFSCVSQLPFTPLTGQQRCRIFLTSHWTGRGEQNRSVSLLLSDSPSLAQVEHSMRMLLCACMLSHFSRVRLFVTPMGCSPSGSSVPGIFQARILEWVAMPSFRGSSQPRDRTCVSQPVTCPALVGGFFATSATWEAQGCF